MSKLQYATKEIAEQCLGEARKWLSSTKAPFNDCGMCARGAVAEYLANQMGYTLYESVANLGEK